MDATPALWILHLGLGAFHRAHQAVFLQDLHDRGDSRWRLASGNLRPEPRAAVDALRAQGGRYTLETVSPSGARRYRSVNSIARVVPFDEAGGELLTLGAAAATRIVSFTVTEAGYALDPEGRLDALNPEIIEDLRRAREGRIGRTLYGALVAMLRGRIAAGSGPLTLLNCDNLRHNGDLVRGGLAQFIDRLGDRELQTWTSAHVRCPNAMVDRITPRPDAELRARVRAATGRDDAAALTSEAYIQWVIEDDFAAGRPAWESVGVRLVASVQPYEEAKIRLLNASHSVIAWAGTLAGYRYIHEGAADAEIRAMAHAYVTEDAMPCLTPSPVDLPAYRDTVLARFANAAIADTNQRVAMDGYTKLSVFVAPTVRDRLASRSSIAAVAVLPALYLHFLRRWQQARLPFEYEDSAFDERDAQALCAADDPVAALCALPALWGAAAGDARLVDAVRAADEQVRRFVLARGR
ncbi:MAG: mannitol dehydrogenase family protein [Burkholderiales bacterium]|nr:mannitol dehydrogenase family protein [Burkholderiales bacterium]